jgi:citrate synthase
MNHPSQVRHSDLQPNGRSYVGNSRIIARGHPIETLTRRLSFADMIFYQVQGRLPTETEETMLNHYIVSLAEHGDTSPSTHGARVTSNVGGTFSMAAINFVSGASGRYHFGALEYAMEEIQTVADQCLDISNYVQGKIDRREKASGFGHRFHRTDTRHDLPAEQYDCLAERKDPRVNVLLELADSMQWDGRYLRTVREIGRVLYDKKQIPINVDGVGAGLLLDMSFPPAIAALFPIIGRLPMIARYHLAERCEPTNRFVDLVDRTDPRYGPRTVDLELPNGG